MAYTSNTLTLEDLYSLYSPHRRPSSEMTTQDLHALFSHKAKADAVKQSMTVDDFVRFVDAKRRVTVDEPSSSEDDEEMILTPKLAPLRPHPQLQAEVSKADWRVVSGSYIDRDEAIQMLDTCSPLPAPAQLKPEIALRIKAAQKESLPKAQLRKKAKSVKKQDVHDAAVIKTELPISNMSNPGLAFLATLVDSLPPLSPPPPVKTEVEETDIPPLTLRMRMPTVVHPRIPSPQRASKETVKPYTLTRVAIARLLQSLPKAFPKQAKALSKLSLDDLTGEGDQEVVWTDGVGRLRDFEYEEYHRGPVTQVFVDHSNILFAHIHHLETLSTRYLPPKHQRTLSLPALSLLLQRGRPAPPGSLHLVGSSPLRDRPDLDRLIRLGWEINVLKRVSAGSDVKRFREQGVDELLQLKMLQALNAYPPPTFDGATIVLATGDAQSGQFNRDGFVGVVREALRRGWNVELWSFKKGLSRTWKETAKAEGWTRFSIRTLDEFAEDLVEIGDGIMTDE